MKLGVIGGTGWIGLQVVKCAISAGLVVEKDVWVSNRLGDFSAMDDFPGVNVTTDNTILAAACDHLVLSVPPRCVDQLQLSAYSGLVISVMAGVQLMRLQSVTSSHRIIRAMPNAAIEVGQSMTPWYATAEVSVNDKRSSQQLFDSFGQGIEVDSEDKINYLTALSGSSHGTIAYFQAAMIQSAIDFGLSEAQARVIVQQIFSGNSQLMQQDNRDPKADVDLVIEYAGTTAALCNALNSLEVDQRIGQAVMASYRKACSDMDRDE